MSIDAFLPMTEAEQELQKQLWSVEIELQQAKQAVPRLQQQLRLLDRARKRTVILNRLACHLTKEVVPYGSVYPCEEMPEVPDPALLRAGQEAVLQGLARSDFDVIAQ